MRTLFRPVGLFEMKLIVDLEMRGFPPRLLGQPIFYPVQNKKYADQIANQWNTKDKHSGFVGFITEWDISEAYISRYDRQVVGAAIHEEIWIPAEELDDFNQEIKGPIRLIDAFYGEKYTGTISSISEFIGNNAIEHFLFFKLMLDLSESDLSVHVIRNWQVVLFNFRHWSKTGHNDLGVSVKEKLRLLSTIVKVWRGFKADIPLLGVELIYE